MLLIDSNVFIEYFRGREQAIEYFENLNEPVTLSVLILSELLAGVRNEGERQFITNMREGFDFLLVTYEIADLGGQYLNRFFRSHGTGTIDALLAATAELHDLKLVTFNLKHYPMLGDRAFAPY